MALELNLGAYASLPVGVKNQASSVAALTRPEATSSTSAGLRESVEFTNLFAAITEGNVFIRRFQNPKGPTRVRVLALRSFRFSSLLPT